MANAKKKSTTSTTKTTMKSIFATVTDTNHRSRGTMPICVEFARGLPISVEHDGRSFSFGGKRGTNAKTGSEVVELASAGDARIWVTLDAKTLYED